MKLTTNHGMVLCCLRLEISHFGLTQNSANVRAYERIWAYFVSFPANNMRLHEEKRSIWIVWLLSVSLSSCNTYPFFLVLWHLFQWNFRIKQESRNLSIIQFMNMWKQYCLSWVFRETSVILMTPWINWHRTASVPTLNKDLTRSLHHNLDLNKFYINYLCRISMLQHG